jgi:hypothetical protein
LDDKSLATINSNSALRHDFARKIVHSTIMLVAMLLLAALSGWGSLAIYFGNSHTGTLQTVLAGVYGLTGVASIASLASPRWRARLVGLFLAAFFLVLAWWLSLAPSNDRVWQADVAQLPYATIAGDLVTVHNIRNLQYRSETDYTPAYYTKTYDLRQLDSVDLYAVYWMGPAIAHTIISFGFGGKDYLAVSIEARKERGEAYSSIKGFFRQYELIYIVADERDVIRLRTNYRKDPPEEVYLYRLKGSPESARKFFLDYLKSINELVDRPQFYNTLTENCTNAIPVRYGTTGYFDALCGTGATRTYQSTRPSRRQCARFFAADPDGSAKAGCSRVALNKPWHEYDSKFAGINRHRLAESRCLQYESSGAGITSPPCAVRASGR